VYALTTARAGPTSGNSQATGTRAVTTGELNPAWLRRCCAEPAGQRRVRGQLKAHPLTTGLHVAAVADGLRDGDQLVLGASNPVRDAALVGLNPHGIRCGRIAVSRVSTARCPRRSARRWRTNERAAEPRRRRRRSSHDRADRRFDFRTTVRAC
jgi:hypothetical protein